MSLAADTDSAAMDRVMREVFGLHEFRPHQREIIDRPASRGEDAFVLMPTGGGKSL